MSIIIKSKRELNAHRAGDAAVLAARAARANSLIAEPTDDEFNKFAVGGDAVPGGKMPCRCNGGASSSSAYGGDSECPQQIAVCRPMDVNSCYHQIAQEHGCPMKIASGGVYGVAGGGQVVIRVQPIQSDYFLPIALRLIVRDAAAADTLRFFLMTAVTIKNYPQENFHDPAPTIATVIGVDSSSYNTKTQGDRTLGVEVAWGPFARTALADNLVLTGISLYGALVSINARAELHGYELDSLPKGWKCGQHPNRVPVPAAA